MKREDYIELIMVAEGVRKFEENIHALSGCTGDYSRDSVASKLIRVVNVLSRNAASEYDFVSPDGNCSEQFHKFYEIIENTELSAEEKYDLLMGNMDR